MVNKLLLVFLLSLFLFSNGLEKKVDSLLIELDRTVSRYELLNIHNGFKNIYVKSIINNDKDLQSYVLEALVKSSKVIGDDSNNYQEELNLLNKKRPKKRPKIVIIKPKLKEVRKFEKTHNSYFVKKITNKNNTIVLKFNKKLSSDIVKSYELNSKGKYYKDIFDIEGTIFLKYKKLNLNNLQRAVIAQYKPNIIRIVLQDKSAINSIFVIENDTLTISLKTKRGIFKKKKTISRSKKFNKIIILDPGHGGKDPGAVGYKKLKEKDIVLKVAKKLSKKLYDRGYKVYLTRDTDKFISLHKRTEFANKKNADLFISLHLNAAPNKKAAHKYKGVETFFLSMARSDRNKRVAQKENSVELKAMNKYTQNIFMDLLSREKIVISNKLAIDIQKGMMNSLKRIYHTTDGGVREAPFWVLVGAQMPSVLVEIGYVTNKIEATRLKNYAYINRLANGIADGIDSYFVKNQ